MSCAFPFRLSLLGADATDSDCYYITIHNFGCFGLCLGCRLLNNLLLAVCAIFLPALLLIHGPYNARFHHKPCHLLPEVELSGILH
jgi:hypothetical protein